LEHAAVDDQTSEDRELARTLDPHARFEAFLGLNQPAELTRFWLLRLLGFVYTAAFASLVYQVVPLIGHRGLMPAASYLARGIAATGSPLSAFVAEPSLFYLVPATDTVLVVLAWTGLALSVAVWLGVTNALVMFLLWALYRSFIAVGQLWYGYGWELLLVETGFLAIFLCPLSSVRPFPEAKVPWAMSWLFRWLACRVMLGAGLIKLRGDPCWRDLTCLDFHFETQPIPNPLSPLFHFLPHAVHAGGVLFNHLAELVLPLCLFGPRRLRVWSGGLMIAFQGVLILSGNLSYLNWLTIVPLVASFDDRVLARVTPAWLRARVGGTRVSRAHSVMVAMLALLVAILSIGPVANMLSRHQRMNAGFEQLMLVNSYGAFGSVGRERPELIIEGTRDDAQDPAATWQAYELPFKPGDPSRPLRVVSPLQPRIDWQIWFAAMSRPEDEPWMLHLIWKLLHADREVRRLFAHDPFAERPPRAIRVLRYRYRFAPRDSPATWTRELEGLWLPPLSANGVLRDALRALGYLDD
jgi:hypothetical protein